MDKNFKPYVSSNKTEPEITVTSILVGVIFSIVFGAANAYLGLRVGMTVSASIPAAVIAMGVIRIMLKKNSILESNMVQTIGSAGESLAAGAIFTLPALFLWAAEGVMEKPSFLEITTIALLGGLLGVFFMIPLRNALIVKEHESLPYPEAAACAEVLLAGENEGTNASTVFWGMGIAAFFKFIIDGLKIVPGEISIKIKGFAGEFGTQIYPAVLSVGYICGPKIASYMFSGGILSWLVIIPLIVLFGENTILYPESVSVSELYLTSGASGIWSSYIRYIGAGALAAGGIISLIKVLPLIFKTFKEAIKGINVTVNQAGLRTEKDVDIKIVIWCIGIIILLVWLLPVVPVSLLGAIIVAIFGFFFATVSSRMVGLVGGSNNPVSGMAIATLIVATLLLKLSSGQANDTIKGAIAVGSIICIIAAISGDCSQDLKTGFLLGATPKKQQIGEIIGVVASAISIGFTLYLLDSAWGFGTEELAAPQATLMKMIVEGVMNANLPWVLVVIGAVIAIIAEILGIPVLPIAIGIYLPIHLNACIMTGGILRHIVNKSKNQDKINGGILFSSGMIAGEGLVGILLAVLSLFSLNSLIDASKLLNFSDMMLAAFALLVFGAIIFSVLKFSLFKKLDK